MAANHEKLLQKTFLLVQETFSQARIFPRHVGMFFKPSGAPISINMKGMADAYMLLPYNNDLLHIELEFKYGNDRQSEYQKNWQKIIEDMNGLYIIVKKPEDAINAINKKWPDILN